jgi:hypothetical protein
MEQIGERVEICEKLKFELNEWTHFLNVGASLQDGRIGGAQFLVAQSLPLMMLSPCFTS